MSDRLQQQVDGAKAAGRAIQIAAWLSLALGIATSIAVMFAIAGDEVADRGAARIVGYGAVAFVGAWLTWAIIAGVGYAVDLFGHIAENTAERP